VLHRGGPALPDGRPRPGLRRRQVEVTISAGREIPVRSEQDKMLAGELYDALDPVLCAGRRRARDLLKVFNDSRDEEQEKRLRLLTELFGAAGEGLWIEPPFYCDYGSNITLGSKVYLNFNCVILDPAPVRIGSNVFFGPAVQVYTATHPLSYRQR